MRGVFVVDVGVGDDHRNVLLLKNFDRLRDVARTKHAIDVLEHAGDRIDDVLVVINHQNRGRIGRLGGFHRKRFQRHHYRCVRGDTGDLCGLGDDLLDLGVIPWLVDVAKHLAVIDRADDGGEIGISGEQHAHGVRRQLPHPR